MMSNETLPAADAGRLDRGVRPACWVRHNGLPYSSGVASFGATCPPGWVGAAVPMYDQATIDAAKAQCAMLRDALAALVGAVGLTVPSLGAPAWHAFEDARQALVQCGGPNV